MKCQYCGYESEIKDEFFEGFLESTIPIEEWEERIEKWGRNNWLRDLDREDLTSEEIKELRGICFYDQLLNSVGRGCACISCLKKADELYEKYYK